MDAYRRGTKYNGKVNITLNSGGSPEFGIGDQDVSGRWQEEAGALGGLRSCSSPQEPGPGQFHPPHQVFVLISKRCWRLE